MRQWQSPIIFIIHDYAIMSQKTFTKMVTPKSVEPTQLTFHLSMVKWWNKVECVWNIWKFLKIHHSIVSNFSYFS